MFTVWYDVSKIYVKNLNKARERLERSKNIHHAQHVQHVQSFRLDPRQLFPKWQWLTQWDCHLHRSLFTKIYKEQPGRSDSNWWIEELWVSIKEEFWGRADFTSSLSTPVILISWCNPPKTLFKSASKWTIRFWITMVLIFEKIVHTRPKPAHGPPRMASSGQDSVWATGKILRFSQRLALHLWRSARIGFFWSMWVQFRMRSWVFTLFWGDTFWENVYLFL